MTKTPQLGGAGCQNQKGYQEPSKDGHCVPSLPFVRYGWNSQWAAGPRLPRGLAPGHPAPNLAEIYQKFACKQLLQLTVNDRGPTVHGVPKSRTRLSNFHFHQLCYWPPGVPAVSQRPRGGSEGQFGQNLVSGCHLVATSPHCPRACVLPSRGRSDSGDRLLSMPSEALRVTPALPEGPPHPGLHSCHPLSNQSPDLQVSHFPKSSKLNQFIIVADLTHRVYHLTLRAGWTNRGVSFILQLMYFRETLYVKQKERGWVTPGSERT